MTKSRSHSLTALPRSSFALAAFRRYARELRRYFDRRLGQPHEVEDLAQEVYLRLLRIDSAKHVENPLAFVYGVAHHVLADHISAERRAREALPLEGEVSEVGLDRPSEMLADQLEESLDVQQQVARALEQLPPMHAAVVLLRDRDGLSQEEVAERLSLSVHTVKKYIAEGHAMIRLRAWKQEGT
jgi:RNA polymerase sigma-70 factor (ECF subfamily)